MTALIVIVGYLGMLAAACWIARRDRRRFDRAVDAPREDVRAALRDCRWPVIR